MKLAEIKPHPFYRFQKKLWGPIPWLLEISIVPQILFGAYIEAGVIGGLLLFNATLGFIQEVRAGAVPVALKQRLALSALVLRDGAWVRLPASLSLVILFEWRLVHWFPLMRK